MLLIRAVLRKGNADEPTNRRERVCVCVCARARIPQASLAPVHDQALLDQLPAASRGKVMQTSLTDLHITADEIGRLGSHLCVCLR